MNREFLTAEEYAALFGCHPETVKRMARNGKLPAFKLGRHWFFTRPGPEGPPGSQNSFKITPPSSAPQRGEKK